MTAITLNNHYMGQQFYKPHVLQSDSQGFRMWELLHAINAQKIAY